MADKKEYEVIGRIDFGGRLNDFGELLPEEEQPNELFGVYEPTPEGQDNPKVSLEEARAQQAVEAGALKPAGEDSPTSLDHDNPEELGYEGEALRNQEQKSQSKSSKSSASSAKSKE